MYPFPQVHYYRGTLALNTAVFVYLHDAEDVEVVVDLLGHLVHVGAHEAHVLLAQAAPVPRQVVLVLQAQSRTTYCKEWSYISCAE